MATGTTYSSNITRVVLQKYANGSPTGPEIEPSLSGRTWTANLEADTAYKVSEFVTDQPSKGPGPYYFTTDSEGAAGEQSTTPPDDANLPATVLQADLSEADEGDVLQVGPSGTVVAVTPAP